jgi:hypothetical protein
MAGVHGEHMYGYVDRVPGLCSVATQFFHINFVPLFPLGTYIVLEGASPQQGPQGKRIPMNAKSVLVGYFRGWVGLAAVGLFAYCAIQAGTILLDGQPDGLVRGLVIAGLLAAYCCVWWAMLATHRSWLAAWGVVLAATGGYFWWDHANPPPPKPANPFKAVMPKLLKEREELPTFLAWAHGCLFALCAMRTFDTAGRLRAYDLGEMLGLTEEQIDEIRESQSPQPDGQPKADEYSS